MSLAGAAADSGVGTSGSAVGDWRTRRPLILTMAGVAAVAWFSLLEWGGTRAMRLGLLTGGPLFMSMSKARVGSVGTGSGTPATTPGMQMSMGGSAHGAGAAAAKMTMLGVSFSPGDRLFSAPVFGVFLVMWLFMLAAMMLVVLLPMSLRYHDSVIDPASTTRFVLADLAVWAMAAIPAYLFLLTLNAALPSGTASAIRVGAVLVAAAGVYELTPVKRRAHLRCCVANPDGVARCCSTAVDPGTTASWRSGLRHGLASLTCAGPHMAVLLLIGMMNVGWMLVLTLVMIAERVFAWGAKLSVLTGATFMAVAVVLLASPRPLPALT